MQVYERRSVLVQRDLDLVRDLLLHMAQDTRLDGTRFISFEPSELGASGRSPEELAYHLAMLLEEDFLDGLGRIDIQMLPVISKVTWKGHEFWTTYVIPIFGAKPKNEPRGSGA